VKIVFILLVNAISFTKNIYFKHAPKKDINIFYFAQKEYINLIWIDKYYINHIDILLIDGIKLGKLYAISFLTMADYLKILGS